MKNIQPGIQKQHLILSILITSALMLFNITLFAQKSTDFSGKWEFNKAASSPGLIESNYDGVVILIVTQDSSSISFSDIWKSQGNADFNTASDSYALDGKEQIIKSSFSTSKKSAKWSNDKKVLTITNIDKQELKGVLQDFIVIDTYKLSDDKLVLTIERYSKNPVTGETNTKKVYHKI